MPTNIKTENTNGIMPKVDKLARMPPEQRRELVLSFMAEHGLALKPAAIYRNMRLHHRISFTDTTVQNILSDLTESGDLQRVDPSQLAERELAEVTGAGRGAYIVTEAGRERAQSLSR